MSSTTTTTTTTTTKYAELPPLPLPSLAETGERYLQFVAPLLNAEMTKNRRSSSSPSSKEDAMMKVTENLVRDLVTTSGPPLQALLEKRVHLDMYPFSYIEEYWDDMYLEGRWPVPINSNPFLAFSPDPRRGTQELRAAGIIVASLRFISTLRRGQLTQTYIGKLPACMSQFPKMFGSTRIPRPSRDEFVVHNDARHFVIMHRGHCYAVPGFDDRGGMLTESQAVGIIQRILASANQEAVGPAPGIFTTMERNSWAHVRSSLLEDPVNAKSMKSVDSALFVVCLDSMTPRDSSELSSLFLHGVVEEGGVLNRWFDKSVSWLVDRKGNLSISFEHSWGDGLTIGRYMQDAYDDMCKAEVGESTATGEDAAAKFREEQLGYAYLPWNFNEEQANALKRASADYTDAIRNCQTQTLHYRDYGSNLIKKAGVSPDGAIQMAIQLAYYRLHGTVASTYESCNVLTFRHGRTEAIRSVTPESVRFVESFTDSAKGEEKKKDKREERLAVLKAATERHARMAQQCREGRGVDRHLYALRCMAAKRGMPVPALFSDVSYSLLCANILSTSTVATPFCDMAGFGAVNARGYGIGYILRDASVSFNITNFRDSHETDSDALAAHLSRALDDIRAVFPPSPTSPNPNPTTTATHPKL